MSKETLEITEINTSTLAGVAVSLAYRWKVESEKKYCSPKVALYELGINIPKDIIDEWACFDFLKLAKVCLDLQVRDLPAHISVRQEVQND